MKHPELFSYGKEFIDSMEELIVRYELALVKKTSKRDIESEAGLHCLLCNPLGLDVNRDTFDRNDNYSLAEACFKLGCPWMVITGLTCDDWSENYLNVDKSVYNTDDPRIIRARIEQIKEWIDIYKNIYHVNHSDLARKKI